MASFAMRCQPVKVQRWTTMPIKFTTVAGSAVKLLRQRKPPNGSQQRHSYEHRAGTAAEKPNGRLRKIPRRRLIVRKRPKAHISCDQYEGREAAVRRALD